MQLSNSIAIQMFYFNKNAIFINMVLYLRHFGVKLKMYN